MKNKNLFSIQTAIISFLFFMCMNFLINDSPFGLAKLLEITGGHSILDMQLQGYSVDKAYGILDALGVEGRAFTMKYIVLLDFPFPFSYGLFYFITLTLITKNILVKMKSPWLLGMIGVLAALFDWLENVMVIKLLQNYPEKLEGTVKIASLFTQLKGVPYISSISLIIMGLLIITIKKFYSKKSATIKTP